MKIIVFLIYLVMSMVITSERAMSEPVPASVNTFSHGYIASGKKFGVKIGEQIENAKMTLVKKGAVDDGIFPCDRLKEETECDDNTFWESFRYMKIFRDGFISLKFKEGKVAGIRWMFLAPTI